MDRVSLFFGEHFVWITIGFVTIIFGLILARVLTSGSSHAKIGFGGAGHFKLTVGRSRLAAKGSKSHEVEAKHASHSAGRTLDLPGDDGAGDLDMEESDEAETEEADQVHPLGFDVGAGRWSGRRQRPQAQVQEPPQAQAPAAAAADPEPERYINLAFRRAGTEQVVPSQQSLAPNEKYDLRFNIGALLRDRIPDGRSMPPASFPTSALPPDEAGHWLDVIAAGHDFAVGTGKFPVFLPSRGPSWVCDCNPRQPHRCTPEARRSFLLISLTTPSQPGDTEMRIGVYFRNNLLQSCRVMMKLSAAATQATPQSVITDYTINGTLTTLEKLGPKTLNILAGQIKGGEQGFIVNGDFENLVTFRLSEGQLSAAADAAREQLRNIHMTEERRFFGRKRYVNKFDKNNAKSKAAFILDLRQMAPLGSLLWSTLFQSEPELRTSLQEDVLREPSIIQIARASSNFVFPWGLVYDIPLQPIDADKHTVCKIVDEWQDGTGLPVDGLFKCPHQKEHKLNTLCPFGFWGLRHIIEQPPSVGRSRTLASEIRVTNPPARLFICAATDLESEYTTTHLAAMKSGLKFGIEPCDSKAALLSRLETVDPGVVYLYCHGGRAPLAGTTSKIPYLSIGKGEKLTPNEVLTTLNNAGAGLYWNLANPLIFINGCHTAELTTDVLVNFVDTFAGLYSSGVIGTEVTVHQALANEVGADFLQRFQSETAGEALRRTRNRLLCKGNLMGLAYSAYCLSALRIADTASLTAANTVPTGH
jgi:hypothetical protein